ncbi:MAG: hypothetical protein IT279_04600 [Ignavibacteriaceae bacterium]|nr:hypothetical protein [Ignavibacteriaceae bacterium]
MKKQIINTSGSASMFPSHRKQTATNFHFSLLSFLLLVFIAVPLYSQISNVDIAVRLYQQKKYAEAGALFEAQINAGSRQKEVYLGAIDCFIQIKNYDKTLILTQKALNLNRALGLGFSP